MIDPLDLVRPEVHFEQLRAALDNSLLGGRCGVQDPKRIIVVSVDGMHTYKIGPSRLAWCSVP
jgi:hypothetical protein